MNKKFNLNKYIKKAFYEDGRGYWESLGRSWQNCYKCKSDEGKGPQDAWNNCMEEYQTAQSKSDWTISYSSYSEKGKKPYFDAKTPATQKIQKK